MISIIKFFKDKERYLYLEYGVLSLLIIWPLLAKGYVFAMDLPWPTRLELPSQLSNFAPIEIVLWLLNFILPSWLIQKIVIFSTFFFAGLFSHKLIKTKHQWPKYFVGLFYLLTPYLYSRFLYGQLWLCLTYALLPLLLRYLLNLFAETNWKNLFKCLAVFCLIGFIGLPFSFISALIIGLAAVVHLIYLLSKNNFKDFKKTLFFITILFALFIAINSFWILSFTRGENLSGQTVQLFDRAQLEIFKTDNSGRNVFFNVLSMYGFWGDRQNLYALPKQYIPFWWLISGVFIGLAVSGFIEGIRKKEKKEVTLLAGLLIIIGTVLSVGIASETLRPLILWLNDNVPFYEGFREPQKFVALIVLGYCILCSEALISFSEKIKKTNKDHFIMLALMLVIFYNPLMFNGLRGQMFVSNFPDSWAEAKTIIDNDSSDSKTLIWPWHLYMSYDFTRNKIVGPLACDYFKKDKTICGDNMELENTYALTSRPISVYMNELVLSFDTTSEEFVEKLESYGIKYIIILKEVDWQKYDSFLQNQTSFNLLLDRNEIKLYRSQF